MIFLVTAFAWAGSLPKSLEKETFFALLNCHKNFSTSEKYSSCVKPLISETHQESLEHDSLLLFRGLNGNPALRGCAKQEEELLRPSKKAYCFTADFPERKALGVIEFDATARVSSLRLF